MRPIPSTNLPKAERPTARAIMIPIAFSRGHTFLTKQPEDKGSKDCWKQAWED